MKTLTAIVANSLTSSTLTYSDGSTVQLTGAVVDLCQSTMQGGVIVPPTVPTPMLHAALMVLFAELQAQITAQTAAAAQSTTALNTLQGQVNAFAADAAMEAQSGVTMAQSKTLPKVLAITSAGIQSAAQAEITKHQAALAAAQAKLAAVVAATPSTT